jgi:hypothetical protein
MSNDKNLSLRHVVATIAYRGGKALRGAPDDFAHFRAAASTRTPGEILAHVGDLLDWSLKMADGKHEWRASVPLDWEAGAQRFFAALEALDRRLADDAPLGLHADKLFQAPLADALTHVGQIAMLRRMAGSPIRGENYAKAEITAGSGRRPG